jgi:hypothetical protein
MQYFLTAGGDRLGRYWSQQRGRNQNSNGSLGVRASSVGVVGREARPARQAGKQAGNVDELSCLVRQLFVGRRGVRLHKALIVTEEEDSWSSGSFSRLSKYVGCGMRDEGCSAGVEVEVEADLGGWKGERK